MMYQLLIFVLIWFFIITTLGNLLVLFGLIVAIVTALMRYEHCGKSESWRAFIMPLPRYANKWLLFVKVVNRRSGILFNLFYFVFLSCLVYSLYFVLALVGSLWIIVYLVRQVLDLLGIDNKTMSLSFLYLNNLLYILGLVVERALRLFRLVIKVVLEWV